MRIRVTSPAGLFHGASGFKAWEPGEYDFPGDPAYAGWLKGEQERGNVEFLAPAATMLEGAPSVTTDGVAGGFAAGDRVEYTNTRGETRVKTVLAVNADSTLDLGPKLRAVDPAAVRRVEG